MPARRRLDTLTTGLALLAVRRPRLALTLASTAGALRQRLTRRWPGAHEVAALFPEISHERATRIAAAIGALEERNAVLVRCLRRFGIGPMRPLVAIDDALRSLEGPCILATFHVSAMQATGIALEVLGKPVLAFRYGSFFKSHPPVELLNSKGDEQQRASEFIRAHRFLTGGGLVAMALDAAPGTNIITECLGRPLALTRGAFALARMTGAPVVPFTVRWTRQGAHAAIGAPLSPAAPPTYTTDATSFERDLACAASRWLERYLRETPEELTLGLLRELLYERSSEE